MTKKKAEKSGTKKTRASGARPKKKAAPAKPRREVDQGPLALLILLVLVVSLGLGAHFYFASKPAPGLSAEKKSLTPGPLTPSHKQPFVEKPKSSTRVVEKEKKTDSPSPLQSEKKEIPKYEVFPRVDVERKRSEPAVPGDEKPRVALIIDDIGYDPAMAEAFMTLGVPLTLSILPHSPHGVRIANKAHIRGYEIMLHLPMEPQEYPRIDPGPGGLLLRMDADELISVLETNLAAIPHIRGVNNHMGSALTASESHMNQLFIILKKRNFFFIDSRTAAQSRCRAAARMFQVPFGERDVFLDHVQTQEAVEKELEKFFRIAKKHGSAIGIGHPHRVTLEGLRRVLPEVGEAYTFVYASELTDFVE